MKKSYAAICAIVKDEERYIAEWIAYHQVVGFDKMFLYDNGSTDLTAVISRRWGDFVTIIDWPTQPGIWMQHAAYRDFLSRYAAHTEWVMFLDADEFLNLKRDENIRDFLSCRGDASAIGINWRMFGDNGEVAYREGLVLQRFTRAARDAFGGNHIIKTIARCAVIVKPDIHTSELKAGQQLISPSGQLLKQYPAVRQQLVEFDQIQVNHYFVKSYEEWQIKRSRGKADFPAGSPSHLRADGEFEANNKNDELDLTIHRFLNPVRANLDAHKL